MTAQKNEEKVGEPIFMRDKISKICNPWVECPFEKDLLDELLEIDKLSERLKCKTLLLDISEKSAAKQVFNEMN